MMQLNSIVYFILGGLVILGILGIFAGPAISDIPPTPAFKMINSTSGNVTANNYRSTVEFVEGSGIIINANYTTNEITFSSVGSGNPLELYCSGTDKFNSYNATTNTFTCATDVSGSGGENNTASSSGHGNSLVLPKVGVDLPFKGIACTGSIACIPNATDITIDYTATGGGNATNIDDLGDVVAQAVAQFSILYYNGAQWIDQIFKSDTITCGAGQFFSAFDNQTGDHTCSTPSGSGFTTIASEISTSNNATILAYNNTGTRATFKTISAGTGIIITNGSNSLVITNTAPASGGITSLVANVTSSLTGSAHTLLWTIPLTTNSGNAISGVIVATTNTAGSALQAGGNTTNVNSQGICEWRNPLTISTQEFDYLPADNANIIDNAATTWFGAVNQPVPISFTCTVTTGSPTSNFRIFIQAEVASTVSAKAGSYYIKTP